jgi:hypothetical protein
MTARWIAAVWISSVACSSPSAPPPAAPIPVKPEPVISADAALAATPDADVSDEVANAPAWIFRYNAPGRLETWTLRYHGDGALVIVEGEKGATRYVGSVANGTSLALTLVAGANKMSLDCKPAKKPLGSKCNDAKAKKLDVLDCFHPDFKTPMTFAQAPGAEFVQSDKCTGYRLLE